ncbi:hypothetical protein AB0B89_36385 [Sphaerisporangium sp. NPDC049002]|uniref:hypothetical protein n=1 Tax=Sphaerisporangium sp. NPDC049002 TaxID=3155392 RepID=UPI0033D11687
MEEIALYDVLDVQIARAERETPSLVRRRIGAWLNLPSICVGDRVWHPIRQEDGWHGYSLRQTRQVRKALLRSMARYVDHIDELLQEHDRLMNGPIDAP